MSMMTKEAADDLAVLLARQPAGCSLAQPFYGDPAIFRHDVDRLLTRHWLCAGHASQAAQPGDYFLFELVNESVIVVRGEDRLLRGFANVCPQRASPIFSAQPDDDRHLRSTATGGPRRATSGE